MNNYFVRRALLIIPTFIGITLVVFAITRAVPGGPVEQTLNQLIFGQEGKNNNKDVKIPVLSKRKLKKSLELITVLINHGIFLMFNGWVRCLEVT